MGESQKSTYHLPKQGAKAALTHTQFRTLHPHFTETLHSLQNFYKIWLN